MKIAFVVPYPIGKAPSQRFRFEQQFQSLSEKGLIYSEFPFLTESDFDQIYKPKRYIPKTISIIKGFLKRFLLMFQLSSYDFVFIHREATPIGPPFFEYIVSNWLGKKVIYDFDDAVWLPNTSTANKIIAKLKWHNKVKSICKWAYKVSCGNQYLANFALNFNSNVIVIPTTVDTELVHNKTKNQDTRKLVVGWTGTHSTISYLYELEDVLSSVQQKIPFELQIISNQDPLFKTVSYKYIPWNKETEIEDLLAFNIGIMPLKNDLWAQGKCGFKAIQYSALGIPAIASNVGVNNKIVLQNENGILCETKEEWQSALKVLLENESLRTEFGRKSSEHIKNHYSKSSVFSVYLSLFDFAS